jgi:hypothetical protein
MEAQHLRNAQEARPCPLPCAFNHSMNVIGEEAGGGKLKDWLAASSIRQSVPLILLGYTSRGSLPLQVPLTTSHSSKACAPP